MSERFWKGKKRGEMEREEAGSELCGGWDADRWSHEFCQKFEELTC